MQNSRHQLTIIILIAAFTLLQLVILLVFGYTPYPDSEGYILLARQCLEQGEPYPLTSLLNEYPFLWNIGSINAVALSLKLFHSVTPLLVLYALMKGATAWFVYLLTRHLINNKAALFALVLYIIYPANYGEATSTLSELPFMFFTLSGLCLYLVKRQYFLGGALIAVANWFRPMGIVFLLAAVIYVFFFEKRKAALRPIAGFLVVIVLLGGMTYHRTGLFLYQAKTGWMALMDYSSDHSPETMAVRDRTDWNVCQKDSAWQSLFIDWLQDHPREYVAQMPRKLLDTYVSDNVNMCAFISDKAQKEYMYEEVSLKTLIQHFPHYSAVQWLTCLNLAVYYGMLVCALLSLLYFRKESCLLPISVIVLGTLLLLFVGHGEARFHVPFMPFFIIIASIFINHIIKR